MDVTVFFLCYNTDSMNGGREMIFQPKTVDYELSPYTRLTRATWIEAAEYMLTGIFDII